MTPKEAIQELKDASDSEVRYGDTEHHYDEVMKRVEALDMAIKSLEQQPCEDCISRRATLKAFAEKCGGECGCCEYNGSGYDTAENCKLIKSMPSVTPIQKVGKWIPCTRTGLPLTEQLRKERAKWYGYKCSKCNDIYKGNALLECNYCPNCGAKMEVDE